MGIYPVREIFYLTRLYLRQPNLAANTYGERKLRTRFYIEIDEFDRLCKYLGTSAPVLKYAFPWYNFSKPGDLSELGPVEDALKMFEEEIGPLIENME